MPVRRAVSTKNVKDKLSKKKAEEAARLAEEAKKKEEERLAEEARKAAAAAEKAKKDAELQAELDAPGGLVRDLKKWLKTVPLSRRCVKRIDRDFSDGVLVAEVIAYYCPEICDSRHFFTWYSSLNKSSNWELLNRKVFPELGFRLELSQIGNVIQPWGCGKFGAGCFSEPYIYKLLHKIREGIAKINPSVYDYRQNPDEEINELNCDPETKPKFERKPRVDLNIKPPLSKIEIEIAQGKYLEEDETNDDCSIKKEPKKVKECCIENGDCELCNLCGKQQHHTHHQRCWTCWKKQST